MSRQSILNPSEHLRVALIRQHVFVLSALESEQMHVSFYKSMSIEPEEPYLFRRGGHEADKFYASFISSSSTSPLSLAFQLSIRA